MPGTKEVSSEMHCVSALFSGMEWMGIGASEIRTPCASSIDLILKGDLCWPLRVAEPILHRRVSSV